MSCGPTSQLHQETWFALPAATFLGDVPALPDHVRVNAGVDSARQHLASGSTTVNGSRMKPCVMSSIQQGQPHFEGVYVTDDSR
eukprot:jgi/Chrzof1/263/Cz01g09060.t1